MNTKKTVTVRIAVVINERSEWAACGHSDQSDADASEIALADMNDYEPSLRQITHYIEAEIPVPEVPKRQQKAIQGKLVEE